MKKLILTAAILIVGVAAQAQGLDFGIKAGANFANFNGDFGDVKTKSITNFHAGLVAKLSITPNFAIQPEVLYSSQGAKYDDVLGAAQDLNLDYISVPVLAKFYVLPKVSLVAGPQFSFLVNDVDDVFETNSFDLAAAGGIEVDIIGGLFAQARYTIGITEVSKNSDAKNAVFQLSLGYLF